MSEERYGVGDNTVYYAWCKHEGCEYITDNVDSERVALSDIQEHLESDHSEPVS